MRGDGECGYCQAPRPIGGEIQHARLCPYSIDASAARLQRQRRGEPLPREEQIHIARAAEAGWSRRKEKAIWR